MSIQATEAVSPSLFGAPTATASPTATADKDMFLQLLVAQMRYQDPLTRPTPASSSPSRRSSPPWRRCRTSPTRPRCCSPPDGLRRQRPGRPARHLDRRRHRHRPAAASSRGVTFGADGPASSTSAGRRCPLGPASPPSRAAPARDAPRVPDPSVRRRPDRTRRNSPCFAHSSPASAACASTRPCSTSPATTSPTPTPPASRPAPTVFQDTLSQMLTGAGAASANRGGTNPIQVGPRRAGRRDRDQLQPGLRADHRPGRPT